MQRYPLVQMKMDLWLRVCCKIKVMMFTGMLLSFFLSQHTQLLEKLTAEKGELLERHHDQVENLESSLKEQRETVSHLLRIAVVGSAACGPGIAVLLDITSECKPFLMCWLEP